MPINNNGIRCVHCDTEARKRCFAYNAGMCDALCEKALDYNNNCKFYKDKDVYIEELKHCAEKLNYDFNSYLIYSGLKSVVDKLLKN